MKNDHDRYHIQYECSQVNVSFKQTAFRFVGVKFSRTGGERLIVMIQEAIASKDGDQTLTPAYGKEVV